MATPNKSSVSRPGFKHICMRAGIHFHYFIIRLTVFQAIICLAMAGITIKSCIKDDTKCFKRIIVQNDMDLLQSDINCLFNWSLTTHLSFHPSKSCHLSFNQKLPTSYTINGITINSLPTHKDLGVLISNNLEWSPHQDFVFTKTYKTL